MEGQAAVRWTSKAWAGLGKIVVGKGDSLSFYPTEPMPMPPISPCRFWLVFVCLTLVPAAVVAQGTTSGPVSIGNEAFSLEVGGTAQVRAAYARDAAITARRLGFGIRRLRVRLRASMGERLAFFVQADGASADFQVLDLALEYRPAAAVQMRAGRIISARPAGFNSHMRIDAVDRPITIGEWAKRTIGADGHDFGLDVQVSGKRGFLRAFLHNGDGDWGRTRGNFREEVGMGDATRGIDQTGLAATVDAAYKPTAVPGLEVGGFGSINTARNPNTAYQEVGRSYATYGAHAYWGAAPGSQSVRLKADLVAIRYETLAAALLEAPVDYRQRMLGASVMGAARVFQSGEVFARYERFDSNTFSASDAYTFTTLGVSFSPSALRGQGYHRERITLAWTTRFDDGTKIASHGLVVQAQVAF